MPSEQSTEQSIQETGGIPEVQVAVEVSGMTMTPVDKSLTIQDMAADAKATGDAIADILLDISGLNVKTASDIPYSSEEGSRSIAGEMEYQFENVGENIPEMTTAEIEAIIEEVWTTT